MIFWYVGTDGFCPSGELQCVLIVSVSFRPQFDADNGRIGWAESACDYTQLVTENGYTDVLSGNEVEDPHSGEKKDEQEEEKEAMDEAKASAETKETGDDDGYDDDDVDDDEGASSNEKKQKPSNGGNKDQHEGETPTHDIQKAIAENCTGLICGGGLVIVLFVLFALCFCSYRCCCAKKKAKIPAAAYTEVELSNGYKDSSSGSSGYKDESDDEDDDEDDAEYGVVSSKADII
jgi:hypothetical protein